MKKFLSLLSLMWAVTLFSGCSATNTEESQDSELMQKVKIEQSLKKDILFLFQIQESEKESVVVEVVMKNPSLQKLESAQTWVSFPVDILEGTDISLNEEYVSLSAPGESEFDNEQGIAKIGVSFNAEKSPEKELIIATLSFTRMKEETAALSFFDSHPHQGGHSQALIAVQGELRNILTPGTSAPFMIPAYE